MMVNPFNATFAMTMAALWEIGFMLGGFEGSIIYWGGLSKEVTATPPENTGELVFLLSGHGSPDAWRVGHSVQGNFKGVVAHLMGSYFLGIPSSQAWHHRCHQQVEGPPLGQPFNSKVRNAPAQRTMLNRCTVRSPLTVMLTM